MSSALGQKKLAKAQALNCKLVAVKSQDAESSFLISNILEIINPELGLKENFC